MVETIRLTEKDCRPESEVSMLEGKWIDDTSFRILVSDGDFDVYKPDGSRLLAFRHGVLSSKVCRQALPALRHAVSDSYNRGAAAGGRRYRPLKKDGTRSRTVISKPAQSGIAGYYDREPRVPYCRATAFTAQETAKWTSILPFVQAVNEVYRREVPDRFESQMDVVRKTRPEYCIQGTAFTTLTVNRNLRTAIHKDQGDLPEGFGVMSVLNTGHYEGCLLVFPKYRVAVDMRIQDVLLADVHEWHGNTPFESEDDDFERISVVLYYRSMMRHCQSKAEELELAQNRQPGEPLYSDEVESKVSQKEGR